MLWDLAMSPVPMRPMFSSGIFRAVSTVLVAYSMDGEGVLSCANLLTPRYIRTRRPGHLPRLVQGTGRELDPFDRRRSFLHNVVLTCRETHAPPELFPRYPAGS